MISDKGLPIWSNAIRSKQVCSHRLTASLWPVLLSAVRRDPPRTPPAIGIWWLISLHGTGCSDLRGCVGHAAAEEQMYPGEAITFDLEPSIEDLRELGIDRLKKKATWKLWQWPPEEKEFLDADSFRSPSDPPLGRIAPSHLRDAALLHCSSAISISRSQRQGEDVRRFAQDAECGVQETLLCRSYMESEHIEEDLRALLPKEEGKPVEKPAEAALRVRM